MKEVMACDVSPVAMFYFVKQLGVVGFGTFVTFGPERLGDPQQSHFIIVRNHQIKKYEISCERHD